MGLELTGPTARGRPVQSVRNVIQPNNLIEALSLFCCLVSCFVSSKRGLHLKMKLHLNKLPATKSCLSNTPVMGIAMSLSKTDPSLLVECHKKTLKISSR